MPTTILLAEDDALIRQDLADELTRLGYHVVEAVADGASALVRARELRPDLVVCCIRLPELDGLSLAATLHRERIAPVLLCTALNDDEMIERACAAGVVGYVVKPWRSSAIKPAIEIALSRHRDLMALEARFSTLEDQLAPRRVVEQARGLLIEKHHMTPREAFRHLQRLTIQQRMSMKAVAEAILLAGNDRNG